MKNLKFIRLFLAAGCWIYGMWQWIVKPQLEGKLVNEAFFCCWVALSAFVGYLIAERVYNCWDK